MPHVKKLKVTNNFQISIGQKPTFDRRKPWEKEAQSVYITDENGAVWEFRPTQGGLQVRGCGGGASRGDAVFIKSEASNSIVLQQRKFEDEPVDLASQVIFEDQEVADVISSIQSMIGLSSGSGDEGYWAELSEKIRNALLVKKLNR